MDRIHELTEGDVPPVRREDLRAIRELWAELGVKSGEGHGVDHNLMKTRCGDNADVYAVWIRASVLQYLVDSDERFGVFVEDGVLEDKLLEVMSTVPIHAMSVDPDEVLRRVTGRQPES